MLTNLQTLEVITYRTALALHPVDAVTGQTVHGGLEIRAWRYDAADPRPVRRFVHAERSRQSGIYGFATLPGLEGYQIGEAVTPESLPYLVQVVDPQGRFLAQTRRFVLPPAQPAVERLTLYPAPNRPTPPGYAAVRGSLLNTTAPAGAPPEVTTVAPAAWARVTVLRPADVIADPPLAFHGYADARGSFVVMLPYPLLDDDTLLDAAAWDMTVSVACEPGAITADQALLARLLPEADPATLTPRQATLDGQSSALLLGTVAVVDADAGVYRIVGPADATQASFTLTFGRPLVVRTSVDGGGSLSVLLVHGG